MIKFKLSKMTTKQEIITISSKEVIMISSSDEDDIQLRPIKKLKVPLKQRVEVEEDDCVLISSIAKVNPIGKANVKPEYKYIPQNGQYPQAQLDETVCYGMISSMIVDLDMSLIQNDILNPNGLTQVKLLMVPTETSIKITFNSSVKPDNYPPFATLVEGMSRILTPWFHSNYLTVECRIVNLVHHVTDLVS